MKIEEIWESLMKNFTGVKKEKIWLFIW